MLRPQHPRADTAPASSWRVGGLVIAGVINIAFVYALTSGLAMKIVRAIPPAMEISIIPTQEKQQPAVAPPQAQMVQPDTSATVAPPDIQIQQETPPTAITASTAPAAPTPDSAASAVGSTHTIPPYPVDAKRLGQQGTVQLRLTIAPTGAVASVDIVQSSGYPELDQSAASWVQSHWKYKPAIQGGTAVASTTIAVVKFDLRKA